MLDINFGSELQSVLTEEGYVLSLLNEGESVAHYDSEEGEVVVNTTITGAPLLKQVEWFISVVGKLSSSEVDEEVVSSIVEVFNSGGVALESGIIPNPDEGVMNTLSDAITLHTLIGSSEDLQQLCEDVILPLANLQNALDNISVALGEDSVYTYISKQLSKQDSSKGEEIEQAEELSEEQTEQHQPKDIEPEGEDPQEGEIPSSDSEGADNPDEEQQEG